MVRLHLQP